MKKGLLIIFSLLSIIVVSCNNKENKEEPSSEISYEDEYYEFQDFDLKPYEIPAIIALPDETANIGASKPVVEHIPSDIKWTIHVGPNFQLLIEDYANITDLIEVEKKTLAEKDFYEIKYLVDEPDLIVYERKLVVDGEKNAPNTVGIEHRSFHVYGQKTVNGITYELKSRAEGHEKYIIDLMAKSIKSFREKEKEV